MDVAVYVPDDWRDRECFVPKAAWSRLLYTELRAKLPGQFVYETDMRPSTLKDGVNNGLVSVQGWPKSGDVMDGFRLAKRAQAIVDAYDPPFGELLPIAMVA